MSPEREAPLRVWRPPEPIPWPEAWLYYDEPTLIEYDGIIVARDDELRGGTKARYFSLLFDAFPHIVWATPQQGGAQLALAYEAQRSERERATLFMAGRKEPHPRAAEAAVAGAEIHEVRPGWQTNVVAKARRYAEEHDAFFLPLGFDSVLCQLAIGAAARKLWLVDGPFDQVWCSAGSGLLSRSLQLGIPQAEHHAVAVGWDVLNPGQAEVHRYPEDYGWEHPEPPPFPSCPNYDRKAWEVCREKSEGRVLFWNVLGPSPTGAQQES